MDSVFLHLAGTKELQTLNLTGTPITNAGLEHLKGLRSLKRIMLSYTRITSAGVTRLRKELPDAKITATGRFRGKIEAGAKK